MIWNPFRRQNRSRVEQKGGVPEVKSVIDLIEKLLSVQLMLEHERPRQAFKALMNNRLAAGYVFGFHDACFQIYGLVNPNDPALGMGLLRDSYKHIFGYQEGDRLFESSLGWHRDYEFVVGRQSGGEDFVEFKMQGTPTLGLQRILGLGFNVSMVERTLKESTRLNQPNTQVTKKETVNYLGAGKVLGKIFVKPDVWRDINRLSGYHVPSSVMHYEAAFARVAIICETIRQKRTDVIASQMLKGIDQYIIETFKCGHEEEVLDHYKNVPLDIIASQAINSYQNSVFPLTELAFVFARRLSIVSVPVGEIAALFDEVKTEAETLLRYSATVQRGRT